MKKLAILGIVALLLVMGLAIVPASPAWAATTYYVNAATGSDANTPAQAQNPATPWLTIQHAIDQASAGDTIRVAAGDYDEDLTIGCDMDYLQLLGAGKDVTTIRTQGGTAIFSYSPVRIEGFHILQDTSGGKGILLTSESCGDADGTGANPGVIQNNKIEGFENVGGSAGVAFKSYNIQHWVVTRNEFVDCRLGVYLDDTDYVRISNNTFLNYNEGVGMGWDDENHHLSIVGNYFFGTDVASSSWPSKAAILVGSVDHHIYIGGNTMIGSPGDSNRGVWIKHTVDDALADLQNVRIRCNNFDANAEYAVENDAPVGVAATLNWWGDASGPSGEGTGTGDAVSTNVRYDPWLPTEFQDSLKCVPVGGEVYPIDKTSVLGPWIGLASILILVTIAGMLALRRRRPA